MRISIPRLTLRIMFHVIQNLDVCVCVSVLIEIGVWMSGHIGNGGKARCAQIILIADHHPVGAHEPRTSG